MTDCWPILKPTVQQQLGHRALVAWVRSSRVLDCQGLKRAATRCVSSARTLLLPTLSLSGHTNAVLSCIPINIF
eukprot:1157086-Pelagomonas_calceolata.AAC.10